MPAIGALSFVNDDGLDSGIAALLTKVPEEEIALRYRDCNILASPDTPHVVCRFAGACSLDDAFNKGSLLLQETLDMLSMTGRADLATRDAQDEHLLWWTSGRGREFALVSTATSAIKVGPVTLTVRDAQGNVVPPIRVLPKHHIGFRFYRLAQVSDDLYDAYRNMYLAFESLLSSRYPKTRGLEIKWLRQSLASARTDLALDNLVPVGTVDPIGHILSVIYDGARLPLFHAKDGKAYFAPVHSAADREAVASALTMLTHVVIRMADAWYSTRRMGGSVNLEIFKQHDRSLFSGSRWVLTDNPGFALNDDLDSESIRDGVHFAATFSETYGTDVRHNITGELPIPALSTRGRLHALYLVSDESTLIGLSPDATVDLTGFDVFHVCVFIRAKNASEPKYMYPR